MALTGGPIDVHSHVISPALVDALRHDAGRFGVTIFDRDDGLAVGFPDDEKAHPLPAALSRVEERLPAMDRQGVAVQVLSTWIDLAGYRLPGEEGEAFARLQNDTVFEVAQSAPERFLPSATVPLQDPARAVAVLEAADRRGFRFVQVATSVVDRPLDEPDFEPFWQAAETLGTFVLVHPHDELTPPPLRDYFLTNALGNPLQTSMALARLIFGGVLERHPRLNLSFAHGGGLLPYQIGRIQRAFDTNPATRSRGLKTAPRDLLRGCYFDTVLNNARAVAYLAETVGPDRLLLGSDFPFVMGEEDPVGTARAGVQPERLEAVLSGNLRLALAERPGDEGDRAG